MLSADAATSSVPYDGTGFERFGTADGLEDTWIRTIAEAPGRRLWIVANDLVQNGARSARRRDPGGYLDMELT